VKPGDITLLVKATSRIYLESFKRSFRGMRVMWWGPLLTGLIYPLLMASLARFLLPLGAIGGLLLSLLSVAIGAHVLSMVRFAVLEERVSLRLSLDMAKRLFFPVLAIAFLFYLLQLLLFGPLASLIHPELSQFLSVGLLFAVVLVFNQVGEIIYLRTTFVREALSEAWRFLPANWLEWNLPLLLLAIPYLLLVLSGGLFDLAVFGSVPQAQMEAVISQIFFIPLEKELPEAPAVLVQLIAHALAFFVMVFRGHLFQELDRGTRRKRIFAEKMEGG